LLSVFERIIKYDAVVLKPGFLLEVE